MNGSTSTVDYIPRTPLDYGSLLCWASNSVGRQSQPCVFQLAPAPPPPRPAHCDLRHPAPGEADPLQPQGAPVGQQTAQRPRTN